MNSKEQLEQFINKNNLLKINELEKENQTNKDFIKIQNEVLKIKEEENKKLKKVIEILKDKNVDISHIIMSKNLSDYNRITWLGFEAYAEELTKEEYDFLKEYL